MGSLTQTDSSKAPFPHSTPETAEFLGEDLLQVRAWAWAGWAGRQAHAGCQYRGWQAGTAVKGLVVSFPAGQGRPRREEKSDSCSRGDTVYSPHTPRPWTSQVEQRLEPAKRAAHKVHKRLQACLQGQSGADMDKRVVSGVSGRRDLCGEGWGGNDPPLGGLQLLSFALS